MAVFGRLVVGLQFLKLVQMLCVFAEALLAESKVFALLAIKPILTTADGLEAAVAGVPRLVASGLFLLVHLLLERLSKPAFKLLLSAGFLPLNELFLVHVGFLVYLFLIIIKLTNLVQVLVSE